MQTIQPVTDKTVAASVLQRQLVFVTGKGGVAKTTVAAALALGSCSGGRDAIVCELGAQGRVATAFGRSPPSGGAGRRAGVPVRARARP